MGNNKVVVWFIALFIPLIGTYHCTTVVNHYHLAFPNSCMPEWSSAYRNMHLTRCIARCSKNVTCATISHDVIHGYCRLSHWSVPLATKVAAEGWSLFKLDPPVPDIDDYFAVGNFSIAISSQQVTKTEAEILCASSGFGRLVEIRTGPMYLAISDYLNSMPLDLKDMYGDIWMAGEYDGGVWKFPDGSLLPITTANDGETDGTSPCIRMRLAESYKYNDRSCSIRYSYMCEPAV